MAFVAPIPASQIAEESEAFAATKKNVLKPRTGSFRVARSYEYQGKHIEIIVLGNVSFAGGRYVADYEQIVMILNGMKGNVISSRFSHGRANLPVLSMDSDIRFQNVMTPALDDYGNFYYFSWHGITHMLRTYGNDQQWVKYEHPDNYYTYHPQQWNLDWSEDVGNGYAMYHLSQSNVAQALASTDLWVLMVTIAEAAIGLYGLLVEVMILAAKAVAAALLIIGAYMVATHYWLEHVVKAEQDDGWAYTYWNGWYLQMSWGGWKDLWVITW